MSDLTPFTLGFFPTTPCHWPKKMKTVGRKDQLTQFTFRPVGSGVADPPLSRRPGASGWAQCGASKGWLPIPRLHHERYALWAPVTSLMDRGHRMFGAKPFEAGRGSGKDVGEQTQSFQNGTGRCFKIRSPAQKRSIIWIPLDRVGLFCWGRWSGWTDRKTGFWHVLAAAGQRLTSSLKELHPGPRGTCKQILDGPIQNPYI